MKFTTALFALAFIALAGAALAQRQDEALDSLMLSSNLQPVNDPIPRLLQQALESASATPGAYGGENVTSPATNATAEPPAAKPAPKSAGSSAAAGVLSVAAAAAAAALLL